VEYFVRNPEMYRDKKIVIAGGGDSAGLVHFLGEVASDVTLFTEEMNSVVHWTLLKSTKTKTGR
jgi:thioredoxin reductase